VSAYPITNYNSQNPNKGYIDEKYTVATDLLWAFFDSFNQTSVNTLNNELDSLTSSVCTFPGHLEVKKERYLWFKNWNDNVFKKYKFFKMHPMAVAHAVALVTTFTGAITKIEVNINITHPLSFSSIIQDIVDWHEAGNAPDLHHCLKKFDTYILKILSAHSRINLQN